MTTPEATSNYSDSINGLTYDPPTEHGVIGRRTLGTSESIRINLDDVRRERTGIHGRIIFFANDICIQFDNINIEKGDQRGKFCRDVVKNLNESITSQYNEKAITHDVNTLCQVMISWESNSLSVKYVGVDEYPEPLSFPMYPFVLDKAGTILFAPAGTGKSYVGLIMAACIANNLKSPFVTTQRPVIYVNLERGENTFTVRDRAVRNALGLPGASNIGYLHARGRAFKTIARKLERVTASRPDTVIILDSISRTGLGTLLDDSNANYFTDTMNSLGLTWVGIGHTPRETDKHVFGSSHFTNGCDIEVRLVGSEKNHTLNLLLETVKANDGRKNLKAGLALDFGPEPQDGLIGIRRLSEDDPELVEQSVDAQYKVAHAIKELGGTATPTQIAEELDAQLPNVSRILNKSNQFVHLESSGTKKLYGLKTQDSF